jgi:hypothetical protein
MGADLTKPFSESCCDGGECNPNDYSAQPCGCDPHGHKGKPYTCGYHKAYYEGFNAGAMDAAGVAGGVLARLLNAFDFIRDNGTDLSESDREWVYRAYDDAYNFYDDLK